MREGDAQRLHQEMAQERLQGLMVMAGGALLLCLVVVVFMIVLTHGIAGPLHFIKQQMGRIRDGKLGDLRPLRKGDGLSEFYETFRDMAGSLREDAAEDIKQVDLALSRAEALAGESDADKELLEILNRLKARKVALLEKS